MPSYIVKNKNGKLFRGFSSDGDPVSWYTDHFPALAPWVIVELDGRSIPLVNSGAVDFTLIVRVAAAYQAAGGDSRAMVDSINSGGL